MAVQCDICHRFFKTTETLKNHHAFHAKQARITTPIREKNDRPKLLERRKRTLQPIKLQVTEPAKKKLLFEVDDKPTEPKVEDQSKSAVEQQPNPDKADDSGKPKVKDQQKSPVAKLPNKAEEPNSVQPVKGKLDVSQNTDSIATNHIPLPFALSANRLRVFLSPLSLWLCPTCVSQSTRKQAWQFKDSGRTYITISMCKECVECNKEMQELANNRWMRYTKEVIGKRIEEVEKKRQEEQEEKCKSLSRADTEILPE